MSNRSQVPPGTLADLVARDLERRTITGRAWGDDQIVADRRVRDGINRYLRRRGYHVVKQHTRGK